MSTISIDVAPGIIPGFSLETSFDSDPAFADALRSLGSGRFAEFQTALDAATSEARARAGFALLIPLSHFALKRFSHCAAAIDAAISTLGAHPYFLLVRAVSRERLNEIAAADSDFLAALAAATESPDARNRDPANQLIHVLSAVCGKSKSLFDNAFVVSVRRGLTRTRFFTRHRADLSSNAHRIYQAVFQSDRAEVGVICGALVFLGLGSSTETDWSDTIFEHVAIPMAERLLVLGRLDDALNFESFLFESFGKARETAAHFAKVCRRVMPTFSTAGHALAATLSPIAPPALRHRYRVAFIIKNAVDLAPFNVVLDVISAVRANPESRLDCAVVGLIADDRKVIDRCAALGIEMIRAADICRQAPTARNLLLATRDHLAAQEFSTVVWVTSVPTAAFALALGLAPVQIFFTMKYHTFVSPPLDGYLTGGPTGQRFKEMGGQMWRVAQTAYSGLFDGGRSAAAADIRSRYGAEKIILGCLGREEKINSVPFLDAVVALLKRWPEAMFLWTGREFDHAIQSHFETAGVARQCQFIGWVDTLLFAQVFDVFLDTFPFPCGVTALQAMAAGKPLVFFDSPEARETGVPLFVQPILDGAAGTETQRRRVQEMMRPAGEKQLFKFAADANEYVGMANELIASQGIRARVGAALKSFVEEFVTDAVACGQSYERHIIEVIEAKAGGVAGPG